MAERGGRRVPGKPASYSGVGRNSKRTDGRVQPSRAPSIQESTDLQQGERAVIEKGQDIAPLGRQSTPRLQPPSGVSGGSGGQPNVLPEHLFGIPSARPSEPATAGLPFGPGPGPEALAPQPEDEREVVLAWLASQPNAPQAIVNMQSEIRASRMAPAPAARSQEAPLPVEAEPLPEPSLEEAAEEPMEEVSPIEPVEEEIV